MRGIGVGGSVLLLAAVALGGCSDLSKALGLVKTPPDEFTVVANAPLTVPPDFGLRPPRSPSEKPAEGTPTDRARQTVFKLQDANKAGDVQIDPASPLSPGEQALLGKAGAGDADPTVRSKVDQDAKLSAAPQKGFVDSVLSFSEEPQRPPPDQVLDASKEAERLSKNNAANDAVQIDRTAHSDLEDKL
jgi:Protein of unknown function (DUF3035)